MTFWSGETLEARLPELVAPADRDGIDCAAYRLRIGPEVYVSPTGDAKDPQTSSKRQLALGDAFAVPPGQFAFLLTEETVTVPFDAIAFISIRATIKFRGLVNVSGFHVDPGYRGRLVFSVFNAGPAPVHLERGEPCFLIWFASLDRETAKAKTEAGFDNIPTRLINPIAGEIQSFAGLLAKIKQNDENATKRLTAVEREQTVTRWASTAAIALLGAFTLRECVPTKPPPPAAAAPPAVLSPPINAPGAPGPPAALTTPQAPATTVPSSPTPPRP